MNCERQKMRFSQRAVSHNSGSNPAFPRNFVPYRLQTNKNATFAASNIFKRIESCKTEVNRAFGTNIPAKAERTGKKLEFLRMFML